MLFNRYVKLAFAKKYMTFVFVLIELLFFQNIYGQTAEQPDFEKIAIEQSAVPIHSGIPGKVPFWNKYSRRFIYAPAFNFKTLRDAKIYKFQIVSERTGDTFVFKSDVPYAPLTPVWTKIPIGYLNIMVIGIDGKGNNVGISGSGKYYKAASFNGSYGKKVMSYERSAKIALQKLLNKNYVKYWLIYKEPDPHYSNYKYPAKIYSALIVGAVTYAKLVPHTKEAERAIEIAVTVADYLLKISFPKSYVWKYFPPTYYGPGIKKDSKHPYIRLNNSMPIYGARAGIAYLDLYKLIGDKKYLLAAKRIGRTYRDTQLKNGSWYLYANPKTGDPTSKNITIPIRIINYLSLLKEEYNMNGLENTIDKALNWMMIHPVNTFDWQGQFEDVGARDKYRNLSREQACYMAIYLFKHRKNVKLAEELVRFSEDQFVIWAKPRNILSDRGKGFASKNWITPCVQEQYLFWKPVTRSAGIMIKTYWYAYKATKKSVYLAKAKSIANALTQVQKAHDGFYAAFFTKYPMPEWLNSVAYPAKIMMNLGRYLKEIR